MNDYKEPRIAHLGDKQTVVTFALGRTHDAAAWNYDLTIGTIGRDSSIKLYGRRSIECLRNFLNSLKFDEIKKETPYDNEPEID